MERVSFAEPIATELEAEGLTVVMSVQTVNKSLNGGLVQMSDVTRRLPRLLTGHEGLRVDRSESVNDDFTTDRLDRVDDDGDCSGV